MPAKKSPPPRLPAIPEGKLTPEQKALMSAIASGPRGQFKMSGPFFCYLHAPGFGELAQKLGAYCRYGTRLEPRQSELAILATAQLWKAHYEWAAHEPQAARAGVKPATIRDLRAGRAPKSAPKDEKAIYAFIRELYRTKRVSDRTYRSTHAILGDVGMVELVGLLGYYAMVAMTLNVFRMPVPEGTPLPFRELATR
ncbi:MAG: carboxymuconolactone decarboxylase family protein [Xanthobacteraceae bacterium]